MYVYPSRLNPFLLFQLMAPTRYAHCSATNPRQVTRYIYVFIYRYMYIYIYTYIYVCVCVCVCVHMCISLSLRVHPVFTVSGGGGQFPLRALLCDEPTANVDAAADARVHSALLALDCTVVVVAHRLVRYLISQCIHS